MVCKIVHLINKRPVGFREGLRSVEPDELPSVITPELLLRGYECSAINIIPTLQTTEEVFSPNLRHENISEAYEKLIKVRERLIDIYNSEFRVNLINQATDKQGRFKLVTHKKVGVGDIVILVEKHTKRYFYPMGRVLSVDTNELGEVTAAKVFKGDSREIVYRHATTLIPLLTDDQAVASAVQPKTNEVQSVDKALPINKAIRKNSKRKAAVKCDLLLKSLAEADSM